MKKRIFCLLLVVAMVSSLGMTAFAEPDIVEPAPQEPAAETTATEPEQPAPVPGTETPVEPAPETPAEPETPSEPTEPAEVPASETETEPVPEGEPAGDVPAAGEEVPGVEDAPVQDTAPATNDGIATISEPAPASNDGIATIGDPEPAPLSLTLAKDKESITTQNAYDCWLAYARGEEWKNDCTNGYITLTLEGAENKTDIQWSVKPDKGGASASPDGSPATTCVTVAEGNKLYLMGGTDLVGCPAGFTCTITVYATVNGTQSNTVTVTFQAPVPEPTGKPEDTTDHYEYGVWLHVENGSFESDKDGKVASVWVEFTDGTRKLPTELPTAVRSNGMFDGWYTEAPTEVQQTNGGYNVWHTVQYNGQKIDPDVTDVPVGVQVLYAAFQDKDSVADSDKLVTYYYDWNGVNGRWGHCLTSSRSYDVSADGHKLTAADLLISQLNWNGEEITSLTSREDLENYWADKTFNGYTFKGWATASDATEPNVWPDTVVKNGDSLYAVWEKDGSSSSDFDRTNPEAGDLSGLRILGALDSSMSANVHAGEGATFILSLFRTPVGAAANDVTWTVEVSKANWDAASKFKNESETLTVTADGSDSTKDGGIQADAQGLFLTLTCVNGEAYNITVSVAAESNNGVTIEAPTAATVSFSHNPGAWEQTMAPTCTTSGEEKTECTVCHKELTQKIYPKEHLWKFQITKEATCTEEGIKQEQCLNCGTTYGDYQEWMAKKYGPNSVPAPTYAPEVIPAKGHSFQVMNTEVKNSTLITAEKCATCGFTDKTEEPITSANIKGDVNGDKSVSITDVLALYKYVSHQSTSLNNTSAADVNGDGSLSISDVLRVFKYVSKQLTWL